MTADPGRALTNSTFDHWLIDMNIKTNYWTLCAELAACMRPARLLDPRGRSYLNPVWAFLIAGVLAGSAAAQDAYKKPPPEVLEVLNAPATPQAIVSPARDYLMLAESVRYPPIADLAQPMLRLAGLRINPTTSGPHRAPYFTALTLKRIVDGAESKLSLPAHSRVTHFEWSPDGQTFAFLNTPGGEIEVWVGKSATGEARKLQGLRVNAAYGNPLQWMPDNRTLLVQVVPPARGKEPARPAAPIGPDIQESSGKVGPVATFEDLLTNAHDEDLFDYYATSQLVFVDTSSGQTTPVGRPAIFQMAEPAPDGQHLLVARVHRPYSYLYPHYAFPKEVEVWDRAATVVYKVASLPLADRVPINGVPTGPRDYQWRPNDPATLAWVEALDEGNPKKKAPFRDRVLMLKAPLTGQPVEIARTEHRFAGLQWSERGGTLLVRDYDRDRRWTTTKLLDADDRGAAPRVAWSLNAQDRYHDPGLPVMRTLPTGHRAIEQDGEWIFLSGAGASPEGDRPFLDRFNLKTLKTERLFRSGEKEYEAPVALLADDASQVLTRRESPAAAPNYYVRAVRGSEEHEARIVMSSGAPAGAPVLRALTQFPDPTPQLQGIRKQLVTYQRADGVQLSFTLYLPPNYREGTRLPTVLWAYPLEFSDAFTAGQVSGSTQRFTTILGPSHLFFLLEGYAILDNATMPIIGDPVTVNNTYVEQLVMSAKAAIDKAVEMGVTDRDRVGVGGHSYGAFMTANLLAHTDLFRAGIARSGAYNRTLTPFTFQSERRTLWEAPEMYIKVSPFMYANKITAPLLLIHGEADDNSGTFPIQSERMYQAIRGNGGTVRLVMLPLEAHGYTGRESIEHVLYEMINWFDKYVKNAPPRDQQPGPKVAVAN